VTVVVANEVGVSEEFTMTLKVVKAKAVKPVIVSPLVAVATVGQPFTYQIVARDASKFLVEEAPDGWDMSPKGLLTAKPTKAGTVDVVIVAINEDSKEEDRRPLRVTVEEAKKRRPHRSPAPHTPPSGGHGDTSHGGEDHDEGNHGHDNHDDGSHGHGSHGGSGGHSQTSNNIGTTILMWVAGILIGLALIVYIWNSFFKKDKERSTTASSAQAGATNSAIADIERITREFEAKLAAQALASSNAIAAIRAEQRPTTSAVPVTPVVTAGPQGGVTNPTPGTTTFSSTNSVSSNPAVPVSGYQSVTSGGPTASVHNNINQIDVDRLADRMSSNVVRQIDPRIEKLEEAVKKAPKGSMGKDNINVIGSSNVVVYQNKGNAIAQYPLIPRKEPAAQQVAYSGRQHRPVYQVGGCVVMGRKGPEFVSPYPQFEAEQRAKRMIDERALQLVAAAMNSPQEEDVE
jgi:hypothetical protein